MRWLEKFKIRGLKREVERARTINHWAQLYRDLQDTHIETLKKYDSLLAEHIELKKKLVFFQKSKPSPEVNA